MEFPLFYTYKSFGILLTVLIVNLAIYGIALVSGVAVKIGIGNLCWQVFEFSNSYAWVVLAGLGIGIMFCASLLEAPKSVMLIKRYGMWG